VIFYVEEASVKLFFLKACAYKSMYSVTCNPLEVFKRVHASGVIKCTFDAVYLFMPTIE